LEDAEVCCLQNHRILGVGRDLCGSSSPTPLPKQGLYGKEWFVSGSWEKKVRTLPLQDPLATKHSLPRIFSRPPASITAFSKKLEASRGRKIA